MDRIGRLEALARLGYGARGVVYLLLGWFSLRVATVGGRTVDSQAALTTLADGEFGRIALGIIALGLVGYGIWRLMAGALDLDRRGEGHGWGVRLGQLLSGAAHLLLAFQAGRMALLGEGAAPERTETVVRDWTAWFFTQPLGRYVLGAVAIGLIVAALFQLRKAWRGDVMQDLRAAPPHAHWVVTAGRAGYAARGIVFALIGVFLGTAVINADPREAGGMASAFAALRDQPAGPYLLGAVAIGFILFGIFSLIEARYRRLDPDAIAARYMARQKGLAGAE